VPLAHAYFNVVLKQLLLKHGETPLEQALINYQRLQRQYLAMTLLGPDAMRQARIRRLASIGPPQLSCLRAVTLAAARLLVVLRLASKIAHGLRGGDTAAAALFSAAESEIGVALQMQQMAGTHHQWPFELMHAVCHELNSVQDARQLLSNHKDRLVRELGEWIQTWALTPPEVHGAWMHTRLSFAIDADHALHRHYCAIAQCAREGRCEDLVRLVRANVTGPDEESAALDWRMLLFAAIYDELSQREARDDGGLAQAVADLQDVLRLSDPALRLFTCFLDPIALISRPEVDGAGNGLEHDSLHELFGQRPTTRVDRELQACIAGMLAVVLGMREQTTHLFTHVFEPGRLSNTYGVCFQYDHEILHHGLHYDCGCDLTEDGEFGRRGRDPWDRHSYYFALWASYAALAAAVLTQPNAQDSIHNPEHPSPVFSPWQHVRHYIHGVMHVSWQHMATKWGLESEKQCVVVLRALEALRERSLEDPNALPSVFGSQPGLVAYERELQACLACAHE